MAEPGDVLGRSLDLGETLATVARLAVPAYADWCFVELLRPDGAIDRVVMEHVDPAKRRFIVEYDERYPLDPDSPVGSPQVIRSGEPILMPEIPDALWKAAAQDPEQLRLMRALAIDNADLHTRLRETRDDLTAIIEGIADAVTAQDPRGRLVYANDAAVRMLGFASAAEMLAASPGSIGDAFEMFDERGEPVPLEQLPGRRALLGERPPPMTVRYRARGAADERWSRI